MKLFCIPYAGGSSTVFYKWKNYLPETINVVPVDYKGHGRRFAEELSMTMEEVVEDLFHRIIQDFDGEEYSFYGHSMGSIAAYELYYKIKESGFRGPEHIFFSGHASPNRSSNAKPKYKLSDEELILAVAKMGGMPEAVLKEEKLVRTMLPIIRNDFRIIESYQYDGSRKKMNCPISVLYGVRDNILADDLKGWSYLTTGDSSYYGFDGNHFFINEYYPMIAKLITRTLVTKQIPRLQYTVNGNSQYILQAP